MASGNDHWCTSPELYLPFLRMVGRPKFGIDPFWNPGSIVPSARQLTEKEDGFEVDWCKLVREQFRDALINGPWSKQGAVVRKCVEQAMKGFEIVMVQPITGAEYLKHIETAPARLRPYKRPHFMKDGKVVRQNRTDIWLVYWGVRPWAFAESYRELGEVDR